MWLVQLYKANSSTTQTVYSISSCDRSELENYIDPNDYVYELSLCNNWDFVEKKKLLILEKAHGTVLGSPRNERLIRYYSYNYGYSHDYSRYISNSSNFIIFEYLTGLGLLIDFYIHTGIYAYSVIPTDGTISSIDDFIEYIKNKTLSIRLGGSSTPKYTVRFDNNCRYYKYYGDYAIIINKPFLFLFHYSYWSPDNGYITVEVYGTPKLVDDITNNDITTSFYDPNADHPINVDNIVNYYFNVSNMSGIQRSNIDINNYNEENAFGYDLVRALWGSVGTHTSCSISIGDIVLNGYMNSYTYDSLYEAAIYTYFPLLRPKLDADGYFTPYPQYDPLHEDSKVTYLWIYLMMSGNNLSYFNLGSYYYVAYYGNWCSIYGSGDWPSWDTGWCNFTVPFRFLSATNCSVPTSDIWSIEPTINNANYLFMISKLPLSSTYSIKGVGCNEVTQPLYFDANFTLYTNLYVGFFEALYKINFLGFGYAFDTIRDVLSNEIRLENSETCFILFSDKLIDDEDDFINIHAAIREALPNSIICYFGDDSKIPNELKNKVVHSNAVVTDLDTNEQMPLVIKYINYAKRLRKLFNE